MLLRLGLLGTSDYRITYTHESVDPRLHGVDWKALEFGWPVGVGFGCITRRSSHSHGCRDAASRQHRGHAVRFASFRRGDLELGLQHGAGPGAITAFGGVVPLLHSIRTTQDGSLCTSDLMACFGQQAAGRRGHKKVARHENFGVKVDSSSSREGGLAGHTKEGGGGARAVSSISGKSPVSFPPPSLPRRVLRRIVL
jgi:hypothetical protein